MANQHRRPRSGPPGPSCGSSVDRVVTGVPPSIDQGPGPGAISAESGWGGEASPATPAGRVERPWGWYEELGRGDQYLVKRLWIAPGCRISLQRHRHRCEHWVVVAGAGLLETGGEATVAAVGTTLFIPREAIHRASAGVDGLGIIEVQRGAVLQESDIERFADDFGRVPS